MVAFHYPPLSGSSGLLRALKFSEYLRDRDWHPGVLTVREFVYQNTRPDLLKDIPADVDVTRAVAFDARRHFSIMGRYPAFLALPDRWSSWQFDAIRRGKALLKKHRFDAIWSTFPIATAHRIGLALARHSGLPWIADLRDSMSEPGYPVNPRVFHAVRTLEAQVVSAANAVTFTAPGAIAMYTKRYPDVPAEKYRLLENGYDESSFDGLQSSRDASAGGPVTLLHSGIVYPSERDPRPFFDALKMLKSEGLADASRLRVVLRATGHDDLFRSEISSRGIDDLVKLEPGIAYQSALQEMMNVDGLLVFQASSCNHQIPAKVYEYFRAGRPIMALTDPTGDTAMLLKQNGHKQIARLHDVAEIRLALLMAIKEFRNTASTDPRDAMRRYSRRAQARILAELLDEIVFAA